MDWKKFQKRIEKAKSLEELEKIEHELFGRKSGAVTVAFKELGKLSAQKKKEVGKGLNEWKQTLEQALTQKSNALQQKAYANLEKEDPLDVTLTLPEQPQGHLHLIPEFIRQTEEVFGRIGFESAYGPEIETEENNFNLLNIPKDHPARDTQDTLWIDTKKDLLLRTQTSPVQIRYMKKYKPPFRAIFPGKVYRKDTMDATHSPTFHQVEGMMVGKDISLSHLKGIMTNAMRELLSDNVEIRFRAGYFPFTEPSMEMDIWWQQKSKNKGKWLEIAGCGMVHPKVLKNGGIDPDQWQGFAFGFGVERLLMIKHQIPDIRLFYSGDLRFLKQF